MPLKAGMFMGLKSLAVFLAVLCAGVSLAGCGLVDSAQPDSTHSDSVHSDSEILIQYVLIRITRNWEMRRCRGRILEGLGSGGSAVPGGKAEEL